MNKIIYILLIMLCTSCAGTYYVIDNDRDHPVEVYYNGIDVYWG